MDLKTKTYISVQPISFGFDPLRVNSKQYKVLKTLLQDNNYDTIM